MVSKKEKEQSFEESLQQLETIVRSLESGDLTLESGLTQFEQGVELYRTCKSKLETVEKRVSKLTADLKEEEM